MIPETDKPISANLQTYLNFMGLLSQLSDDPDNYRGLIHPEAEFRELPNLLNKNGQVRNLGDSLESLKKARQILARQSFEVVGYLEDGEKLAVEKIWTGEMALDIGSLKRGQEMKAYICAVVEFKDGKIFRHRTYDCYEPF